MNKSFYLAAYLVTSIGGPVVVVIGLAFVWAQLGVLVGERHSAMPGMIMILSGTLMTILGAAIALTFIHKSWASIQDGHTSITPGKAVGFLFIPFFNLLWVFLAFWGFARHCNRYIDRYKMAAPKINEGLVLIYCVLLVVSFIPLYGLVAYLASLVVGVAMINSVCDTVNKLQKPPVQK